MAKRKTDFLRIDQGEVYGRPRLTTKEAVEAANTALLEQVYAEKQDKNCWTAQAITSTALGRSQRQENYNKGRAKGAVGPWRALADKYAPTCESFEAFVVAIENGKEVDEVTDEKFYQPSGKAISRKSLRDYFNQARREYAKRG